MSDAVSVTMDRRTLTFSSRSDSLAILAGASIARLLTTWNRWFCTTSRIGAGRVVEAAAALDAEVLRHRDLHALHVGPIPEGLDDRIREAKEQHVVDGALAEVMVDPEDVGLDERAEQGPVQVARRREVLAEGLFDDDTGPRRAAGRGQLLDDRSEKRGRNGEVMRRMRRGAELAAERRERRRVRVVPIDIAELRTQLCEGITVEPAILLDAVLRPRAQLVERPAGLGHADDRDVERAAPGHRLQRGEDFLVRQIARGPEEDERVGLRAIHRGAHTFASIRPRPIMPSCITCSLLRRPLHLRDSSRLRDPRAPVTLDQRVGRAVMSQCGPGRGRARG